MEAKENRDNSYDDDTSVILGMSNQEKRQRIVHQICVDYADAMCEMDKKLDWDTVYFAAKDLLKELTDAGAIEKIQKLFPTLPPVKLDISELQKHDLEVERKGEARRNAMFFFIAVLIAILMFLLSGCSPKEPDTMHLLTVQFQDGTIQNIKIDGWEEDEFSLTGKGCIWHKQSSGFFAGGNEVACGVRMFTIEHQIPM